ncbi:MAG: preprotein translocase subunit SecE [Candidatus Methylomirabilia bacterium]
MGYLRRAQQFLREVAAEFRKVTWPSYPQVVNSTAVVLVVVLVIGLFLYVVDIGLARVAGVILR